MTTARIRLAGNHTYAAALSLGWEQIAATFVDIDDEAAARIVVVDNRTSDLAGYDTQMLGEILTALPDLEGTGYDAAQLDSMLVDSSLPSTEAQVAAMRSECRTLRTDLADVLEPEQVEAAVQLYAVEGQRLQDVARQATLVEDALVHGVRWRPRPRPDTSGGSRRRGGMG